MLWFDYDETKFAQAAVYLTTRCREMTKMKLFKLLYFADKQHLCEYGRPIVGGHYVAMEHGPVHSQGYDAVKDLTRPVHEALAVRGSVIAVRSHLGVDALSETDVEVLDDVIARLGGCTAKELRDLSHEEKPWASRERNAEMLFEEMMVGADPSIVELVHSDQEIRDLANALSLSEEQIYS
ncbi:MAG: hypothetical protein C0504_18635 [Candidatus Solibacter sp.]|nr:hypothetical protein [Candidatus Solibacter sp.]